MWEVENGINCLDLEIVGYDRVGNGFSRTPLLCWRHRRRWVNGRCGGFHQFRELGEAHPGDCRLGWSNQVIFAQLTTCQRTAKGC